MPINSVDQDQIYGFLYSEFFTLYYKDDSGDWVNIPGIESLSQSGAEAPMRDVVSVNGAPTQNMGLSRTGSLSFSAKIMPNDHAWRFLRDAQYKRKIVHFRIDTDANLLFTSATATDKGALVSIPKDATEAVATISKGSDSDSEDIPTIDTVGFGRGSMIVTPLTEGDERYFIISNVNDTANEYDVIEVTGGNTYVTKNIATAIVDQRFRLYGQVPMRQSFSALVPSASNMELSTESEMMTTLTLALRSRLSVPNVINIDIS